MRAFLAIVCCSMLAACAQTVAVAPPAPAPLAERVPSHVRKCQPRPVPATMTSQADVARYLVLLDAAGEDCRRNLRTLDRIIADIDSVRAPQ